MASIEQTKSWLRDVFAHDYAQKSHLLRMVMAKGYGMHREFESQPFPGTSSNTTTNIQLPGAPAPAAAVAAVATSAGRRVWPAVAAAALTGLGGAGLGALVAEYFGQAAEADAQIRVYWGDQEITPDAPAEAVTE